MDNDASDAARNRLSGITSQKQFGEALCSARAAADLSTRALEKLGRGALNRTLISDMEHGHRIFSEDDGRLELFLSLCGVSADELAEWQRVGREVHGIPRPVAAETALPNSPNVASDQPTANRPKSKRIAYLVLAISTALLCSAIVGGVNAMTPASTRPTSMYQTPPEPGFRTIAGNPATTEAAPLTVTVTTPLRSGATVGRFALPAALDLDAAGLATFNHEVINSDALHRWQEENTATPVSRGTTSLTVVNTWNEPVRIIRMTAVKECDKPLRGTYFRPPAEGGGPESNILLGVDLDAADGVFQEMYYTADGFRPSGPDYFEKNTVTLEPGQGQSFTIGAFVTNFSCSFKIRTFVASKNSTVYQDIDFHGQPFRVTGLAEPKTVENPYSGYEAMYIPDHSRMWVRHDPRTAVK